MQHSLNNHVVIVFDELGERKFPRSVFPPLADGIGDACDSRANLCKSCFWDVA